MGAEHFLADRFDARPWALRDGLQAAEPAAGAIAPELLFLGRGEHPLEVASASAEARPRTEAVRALWRQRHRRRPSPLVLVVIYPSPDGDRASVCGPVGEEPPVVDEVDLADVERLCAASLCEPTRHHAVRLLSASLPDLESELSGLRNAGMFASHELRTGVPQRADWAAACAAGRRLLALRGRGLVEALGYWIEDHTTTASVLRAAGSRRAIAVFLDEHEGFEEANQRFDGGGAVTHALAVAGREGLGWVMLTRGSQIRVHAARPDTGVGRKSRAETFVELNLALLPGEDAGYLPLLAGATALVDGGSFEQILDRSGD